MDNIIFRSLMIFIDFSYKFFYFQPIYGAPKLLRRIAFYDAEKKRTLEFLSNNFHLAASTIAAIYKDRWKIELFFKAIKQNLKLKAFLGRVIPPFLIELMSRKTKVLIVV